VSTTGNSSGALPLLTQCRQEALRANYLALRHRQKRLEGIEKAQQAQYCEQIVQVESEVQSFAISERNGLSIFSLFRVSAVARISATP